MKLIRFLVNTQHNTYQFSCILRYTEAAVCFIIKIYLYSQNRGAVT